MGIFDAFNTGNANDARNAQIAGLNDANATGQADLSQGYGDIKTSYAAGLSPLLQNYGVQAGGQNQLASLLGFGPQGSAGIQSTLENLPGYQFTRDQGIQNTERASAAQGFGTGPGGLSGNTLKALTDYSSGLASQNYNNYASQLQPFLGAATTTGGQIAATDASLGGALNANRTTAAGMDYGTRAGIGNAAASADLAGNAASANSINALMQGGKLAAGLFGALG